MNTLQLTSRKVCLLYNMNVDDLYDEIDRVAPQERERDLELSDLTLKELGKRRPFVHNYSWAVPCRSAILEICNFVNPSETILEVGAGTGLWAYLLQATTQARVIATDPGEEQFRNQFLEIEKLNAEQAATKYQGENVILFMCWSRVKFPKSFTGNKYIHIGEKPGGCTSGWPNKKEWELTKEFSLRKWFGIWDNLYFFVRRKQQQE